MLETATIYTKVNDTLFKNDGKYATKKEDFRKIVKDTSEYCREIHVMSSQLMRSLMMTV